MLSILLSAFFAGLVAILVTVAIERWGGLVGGVLGTIPTTIVPAVIGMSIEGVDTEQALAVIPWGMLLNGIFLLSWVILPQKFSTSLTTTTFVSLTIWFILGLSMVYVTGILLGTFTPFQIGISGLVVLLVLGVWFTWRPDETPKGTESVSLFVLFLRGLAAAFSIGIGVWFAGLGLPILAGLASVFPAIFLTSMVALWLAQGSEVPIGAAGPMMLGGASVSIYAIIAMWSLNAYGLVIGSIISWLIAVVCWSLPAYQWLKWRRSLSV
jgi:hypothetical protein